MQANARTASPSAGSEPTKMGRVASAFLAISILLLSSNSVATKELKAPVFLEPISNETVPSGRDVRLACVVDHLGSYKLAWIQQDRSAILTVGKHVITRNPRIGVMHDEHRTWYLIIRNVKPGDAGTYMCQINTEPVTSQIGLVNVVVPPYIKDEMTSKDVRLQEGSSVSLACSSRGSPIPTVKWKREDGRPIKINSTKNLEEVSGPILRLTHLTRGDMGAYLCIASNGVPPSVSKRIQVQVKFRPTVYAPHQLFGVILGQDATLECYVEAWPLGLNYWKRPKGFEILHTDEKYNVTTEDGSQPYKTRMILTIKNFTTEDIGDYNCISNNSQGGAEQVIRVSASTTIITNPNLIDKGQNNAKEGPHSSGKAILKTVNWSKESSSSEKDAVLTRKKEKNRSTMMEEEPLDNPRSKNFFPLNTLGASEEAASGAATAEPLLYLLHDSVGFAMGFLSLVYSRLEGNEALRNRRRKAKLKPAMFHTSGLLPGVNSGISSSHSSRRLNTHWKENDASFINCEGDANSLPRNWLRLSGNTKMLRCHLTSSRTPKRLAQKERTHSLLRGLLALLRTRSAKDCLTKAWCVLLWWVGLCFLSHLSPPSRP